MVRVVLMVVLYKFAYLHVTRYAHSTGGAHEMLIQDYPGTNSVEKMS